MPPSRSCTARPAGPRPVPDDELPVVLPDVDDFRRTGTGRSPLAQATDWVSTTCSACGGRAEREADVSDTFVDSAWYFLRYPSTEFTDRPWDDERTARLLPVDFCAGGPEHVQRHHLYARFITMALHDLGLVPFEEPFPRIRLGGLIVRDGAKMSKSRGNVVTPDEYVDAHGADVLRCALLFSAPWERGGDFLEDALAGIERFFARVWRTVTGPDGPPAAPAVTAAAVRDVTAAIERLTFNVAIARLMELVPHVRAPHDKQVLVKLLAPFAPHLAEELWERLGPPYSVHEQPWPTYDVATLDTERVTVIVQVDGRLRGTMDVDVGQTEREALVLARAAIPDLPPDGATARVVFVPDQILNLVTR